MARPILEPDTAELKLVAKLVKEERSVDLLFLAIRHGRLKSVCGYYCEKQARRARTTLRCRDDEGATPLHCASWSARLTLYGPYLPRALSCLIRWQLDVWMRVAGVEIPAAEQPTANGGVDILEITFESWFLQPLMMQDFLAIEDMLRAGRSTEQPPLLASYPYFGLTWQSTTTSTTDSSLVRERWNE